LVISCVRDLTKSRRAQGYTSSEEEVGSIRDIEEICSELNFDLLRKKEILEQTEIHIVIPRTVDD
jgi:hypothetical protein